MNDWESVSQTQVSVIRGTENVPQPAAYPVTVTPLSAGALLRVANVSEVGMLSVDLVATKGNHVSHMLKYDWDGENPYTAAETYELVRGVIYAIPEQNIGNAVGTVSPGEYLVADTDGTVTNKAQATDFVVFQAVTAGQENGTGSFRVQAVLSQIADS